MKTKDLKKIIKVLIVLTVLAGCMTVKRQDVPDNIKNSFDWKNLSVEEQLKIFNVASPIEVYGTGSIQVQPDGTVEADTSAKARVIGEIINEGMQTAAGVAKTAGGVF